MQLKNVCREVVSSRTGGRRQRQDEKEKKVQLVC
jgi:hypothetical protein